MPPNVWPEEIEGFEETFTELYAQFDKAGARVLSAIAIDLGLDAMRLVVAHHDHHDLGLRLATLHRQRAQLAPQPQQQRVAGVGVRNEGQRAPRQERHQ